MHTTERRSDARIEVHARVIEGVVFAKCGTRAGERDGCAQGVEPIGEDELGWLCPRDLAEKQREAFGAAGRHLAGGDIEQGQSEGVSFR